MFKQKFDLLKNLLQKDRSYRRFNQNVRIDTETLKSLISLTRFCGSGRNLQPLKYYLLNREDECERIYPLLGWAGYLKDWSGPQQGERPAAYIIQFLDLSLTDDPMCDEGLQLQTITLGATALDLGCCIIKSFNDKKLTEILKTPQNLKPTYIIAIGSPVEKVVLEDLDSKRAEGYKYYRTEDLVHHVPKRTLEEILIN